MVNMKFIICLKNYGSIENNENENFFNNLNMNYMTTNTLNLNFFLLDQLVIIKYNNNFF